MKKKWAVWLSFLVLILGLLPNLVQGYTAFADTLDAIETELISQDNLKVTSKVTTLQENNVWEIHYQFYTDSENEARRLKFQFLDSQKQNISVTPEKNWQLDDKNWLIGTFNSNDEGTVTVTTLKTVSKVLLSIQADEQLTDSNQVAVEQDVLASDIGKTYELLAPENETTTTDSSDEQATDSSVSSDTEASVSSSEEPTTEEQASEEPASSKEEASPEAATATVGAANFGTRALTNSKNYTNISPQYTNNSSGIFPTNSWIPTGNTTVLNHQGNSNASSQWDGNTSWNGNPSNLTQSYIEYGGTGSDAEFAIRKYAKETSTPGLYDVYLNVRGNEQKDIKPIDIVLVVDMSGSMAENNRYQYVRQGVKEFFNTINSAGIGDYVNVGFVGYSRPGKVGGPNGDGTISSSIAKASDKNHVQEITTLLNSNFDGGTFTQLGIRKGTKMLQNDTSGNQKMMILLTDGVPTYSYKVNTVTKVGDTVYGTSFSNSTDEPGFTSQLWKNLWGSRVPDSYTLSGNTIRDTWPATLGEAKISKDSGIELHALGIQLGKDSGYTNNNANTYLTQDEVRSRMSLLASSGLYQDANSASDVQTYLNNQAKNVVSAFNTIVNGSISDPIGSQFNYNGTTADVKSVGTKTITNLPNATIENNQLNVSGLNLGKGQEIQLHYQVRLNTETSDFVPNKWYQMNGQTTLTPNGDNATNKVDFGVPSAKGEGVQLDFRKVWEEYDGDKTNRPASVTYEVTRSTTTIANAWQKGFINVEGAQVQDTWTKTTTQLASTQNGATNLWLPKYNAQGVAFNYKISNEVKVDGYDSTQIDETTFKNVKQFIPLQLEVTKENGLGKKLAGAQFKLVNEAGTEFNAAVDSEGSIFTFSNLKSGKYTLTEVKAPDGYAILKESIQLEILNNGSVKVDNESVKVDNHTIKLTVDNQEKGLLPATGGSGRTGYWLISLILIALMSIIGGYYWYRNRNAKKKTNPKKFNRLLSRLSIILLVLPIGFSLFRPIDALADTSPVTFILHKRVYKDSSQLKTVQNNGLVIDSNNQAAKDLVDDNLTYGLNGVTFEVYDATQYVADNLNKMSQEKLLKKVTDTDKTTLLSEIAPYHSLVQEVVTQNVDGEDGVAELTVNPSSDNSAYLLIETKLSQSTENQVEMTATPMLIILPVENPTSQGTYLNTINLYPKNTAVKQVTPPSSSTPPTKPSKPRLPQTGEAKTAMAILGILVILMAVLLWRKKARQ